VAPYPPGGQTDVVSRYFADKLSGVLGQQVIVDNKAGAEGMVGAEIVKNAAPDGYTLLYVNSSMMCINPYVYKKLPYDSFKDFVPVTQHGLAPLAMVTPPSLGLKSVKVRRLGARAQGQGELRLVRHRLLVAHLGRDAEPGREARHDARALQGRGTGDPGYGHIPMTIQDLAASGPAILGGKLVPLAVTSTVRWPRLPDVPTFEEAGYKINLTGWNAILAPAGTPRRSSSA
jgi:tripartite-type tricarboxylate transporter receptor subunit TctC